MGLEIGNKPNYIGALAVFVLGSLSLAYALGLAQVTYEKFFLNRTRAEVVGSVQDFRTTDPPTFSVTRRGFDLGLKLLYKE